MKKGLLRSLLSPLWPSHHGYIHPVSTPTKTNQRFGNNQTCNGIWKEAEPHWLLRWGTSRYLGLETFLSSLEPPAPVDSNTKKQRCESVLKLFHLDKLKRSSHRTSFLWLMTKAPMPTRWDALEGIVSPSTGIQYTSIKKSFSAWWNQNPSYS